MTKRLHDQETGAPWARDLNESPPSRQHVDLISSLASGLRAQSAHVLLLRRLGSEAEHKPIFAGGVARRRRHGHRSGNLRMTFGLPELRRGIKVLVAVVGLCGISEILLRMEERLALRGLLELISPVLHFPYSAAFRSTLAFANNNLR